MSTLAIENKFSQQTQEMLIKTYTLMVKRIAYHLLNRLPYSVLLDDLIQAGMEGLLEAFRHYDVTKGASFETYAGIRIRGNMLDEVRRNDWVPRSVYRNSRRVAEAVKKVENREGREAKDHEVASELNIDLMEYYELITDSANSQLYGFDDLGVTDDLLKDNLGNDHNEPDKTILREDMAAQLSMLINNLPKKERLVLTLYYQQDLNLKEIGAVLEVSESRVSQLHSQAILRIKSQLIHEEIG